MSLDLDAIKARADAATEGPWWAWDRGVGFHIAVTFKKNQWGTPSDLLPEGSRTDIGRSEDAKFIAHARADVPALLAEVERLRALADRHEQAALVAIAQRDEREDLLNKFAYKVGPVEVIGEHSSANDPWVNALDMVTPASEVDRLRQAIELLGKNLQGGSYALVDALAEDERLRAALARAEAVMNKALSEVEHKEVVYLLNTYLATRQAVGE